MFIELRKWQLASEVRTVYSVELEPEPNIAGVKLPDSSQYTGYVIFYLNLMFQGCDEEVVAAGLGNVCHAVSMIATYLEVR